MPNLLNLIEIAKVEIKKINTIQELNEFRIKYLGKKGILAIQKMKFNSLSLTEKKKFGIDFNKFKLDLKYEINCCYKNLTKLSNIVYKEKNNDIDISLLSRRNNIGTLHPISYVIYYIEKFFIKLGFSIIKGPEIDDVYHNFDALNIPKEHPARTSNDTFWFDSNRLLRTQTSNMQSRIMKKKTFPIKIIIPGKVYRNDYDITHTPMFHQIEGLIVDTNVNFSNLKWIIEEFLNFFFDQSVNIRFRTSYFPFTFLSTEVDILGKNKKWLEILGCGMIHPQVLFNSGIDSKKYSGFAFGLGVERIIMLRYGITDIRIFFENNLDFLKQFK